MIAFSNIEGVTSSLSVTGASAPSASVPNRDSIDLVHLAPVCVLLAENLSRNGYKQDSSRVCSCTFPIYKWRETGVINLSAALERHLPGT